MRRFLPAGAAALLLAGCTLGPKYRPPAPPAAARAAYWPTVTLNPSYPVSRTPALGDKDGVAAAATGATSANAAASGGSAGTAQFISLPLEASWEPDLWGKIRNEVGAVRANAQVGAADLAAERLTEESALAQYFFELRGEDALAADLQDVVQANRNLMTIAQSAYQSGVGERISVVEAESSLDAAAAQLTAVGVNRAQYEHAIATLVGAVATGFQIPVTAKLYAPPPVPLGVPSELLERRPDVAAAERTLAAANATIGIGYGAFFPQLTLDGSAGFESTVLCKLIDLPSRFWSIGPSASQVVFDGGLYRAELNQYRAAYEADLAAYRQTALNAFQQVEDALAAVRIESTEIVQQQQAVAATRQSLALEQARYQSGLDPFADVLTLQTTLLADRQTLDTLQIDRMSEAVMLVAALGGGWDRSQLPNP